MGKNLKIQVNQSNFKKSHEPPVVNNGHNCPQANNQPYRHTSERISRSALRKQERLKIVKLGKVRWIYNAPAQRGRIINNKGIQQLIVVRPICKGSSVICLFNTVPWYFNLFGRSDIIKCWGHLKPHLKQNNFV